MTHRCAIHLYYLRGDSWYVQRKVPKHLEQIIGKNIIVRSLGTTDRKTAEFRSENEGRVQELTVAAKKRVLSEFSE